MNREINLPHPFDVIALEKVRNIALPDKARLFHQGAMPRNLYYLVSGAVNLLRHTPSGQTVTLHRARPGDMIAEVSLFSDEYHCDAEADGATRLISFPKADVLQLLDKDPGFAAALVQRFARQVQRYRRQLELRSIQSAKDRVLAGLSDGWLTGSILAFSDDMGLTHEATYRALAKLVAEGEVRKTGRGKYTMAKQSDLDSRFRVKTP